MFFWKKRETRISDRRSPTESRAKVLIPVAFVVPALLVLATTFYFASQQLEEAAELLLMEMGEKILAKTEDLLSSASYMVNSNAIWLASLSGDAAFSAIFHQMATQQMQHFPHFGLVYFGDTRGNHWSNKRAQDGRIHQRITERMDDSPASKESFDRALKMPTERAEERDRLQQLLAPLVKTTWYAPTPDGGLRFDYPDPIKVYDPRLRPWYLGAIKKQGMFWSDVYTWEEKISEKSYKQFGISVSTPVMRQGGVIGVTAIDLILQTLSDFLKNLVISQNGQAFIIDSHGLVVGLPDFSEVLQQSANGGGSVERTHIGHNRDPAKVAAYEALRGALHLPADQPLSRFTREIVRFSARGEHFFGVFKPMNPSYQLDWYVGVLMPEEDIKGPLKQQFQWIVMAIVIVVLLFLGLVPSYMKIERERRFIAGAFSKYVSPNRVAYLLENPHHLSLGGEYRECSFVMTDLTGFTSLMEQVGDDCDPAILINALNEYLEGMIQIAFKHDGTLDRIVGDAVAILFSAPVAQDDHARRALTCALEMDQFASAFSEARHQTGMPFGHTRIGVNSGRVLLGNFGGKAVFDYRALGDPINTASRLESVNGQLGTRICVSGETVSRIPDFRGRPVGLLVLKGKEHGVAAFEPLHDEAFDSPCTTAYRAAYRLMAEEDPGAEAAFAKALETWPTDPLLRFHYDRLKNGERGERIVFTKK